MEPLSDIGNNVGICNSKVGNDYVNVGYVKIHIARSRADVGISVTMLVSLIVIIANVGNIYIQR